MSSSDARSAHQLTSSVELDPHERPDVYYGHDSPNLRKDAKQRTLSQIVSATTLDASHAEEIPQHRRLSLDPLGQKPRRLLIPVEETLKELLAREDIDKNFRITVEDKGPKVRRLGSYMTFRPVG